MEPEKILCPGCGEAMSLRPLGYSEYGRSGYCYHCNYCGWDSPPDETALGAHYRASVRAGFVPYEYHERCMELEIEKRIALEKRLKELEERLKPDCRRSGSY